MKVFIIEDEPPAREKLGKFIRRYDRQIEIIAELESVAAQSKTKCAKNRKRARRTKPDCKICGRATLF